jgi:hypothetical protein
MPMQRVPLTPEQIPAELQPYLGPDAPGARLMMLARGMAPGLSPAALGLGLYQASLHENAKIAESARKTASELPDTVIQGLLGAVAVPVVLDFLSEALRSRPAHLERLLLNQATPDETVLGLTSTIRSEALLELIAQNEARLLRCPKIIEVLYLNPVTRMSTAKRAVELAIRNGLTLDLPAFKEIAAGLGADVKYADPGDQALAEAAEDESFQSAYQEFKDRDETAVPVREGEAGQEAGEEKEEEELDLRKVASLVGLTITQKIRLSLVGSAYHRSLLLRDPNRVVAMAAIKSPTVKETEVIGVTQSRSVNDDVIRFIASNRDWLKSYQIKANLVANPKCPLPIALRFLPHLRPSDLRNVARSKNVASALSTAARNHMNKKK